MKPKLLVIGPTAFWERVERLDLYAQISTADRLLDGLWLAGNEPFDGILLSAEFGENVLRAVQNLRKVAPRSRMVIACRPVEEPLGRRAIEAGAADYALVPLRREEIERALRLPPRRLTPDAPIASAPAVQEITALSDILANLPEGPYAALERLCELVRAAFHAAGASIQFEEFSVRSGDVAELVLAAPIHAGEGAVGRVGLSRCTLGAYPPVASHRLTEYARLIETTVALARDRENLRVLATTDDLTNLRNRRFLHERLEALVADAEREHRRLTLILLDIDDFKSYNDHFGHEVGDHLLREVGALLTACTREADIVARCGGDEFAIILVDAEPPRSSGSEHPRDAAAFAERLRRTIAEHPFEQLGPDRPGPLTISGGLAGFPWDGNSREALLAAADAALLHAKRTGKNRIHLSGNAPRQPTGEPVGK